MPPIYDYRCEACALRWEVAKPIRAHERPEPCPECQIPGRQVPSLVNIDKTAAGDWNTASYHPALGCNVKSNRHARQIAKSRGLEEVGNEPPEKIHAKFEKDQQERQDRRWAEADREKAFGD